MAAAACVAIVACRSPGPHEEPSRRGIISMVPAATEILFALGAGDQVIGVSDFCHHPFEVEELPRYGGILDPSTERIVSSGARAVVLGRTAGKLATACRASGIEVVQVGTDGLAEMDEAIRALGELVDENEEARELGRKIHGQIAEAAASAPADSKPSVVIVVDRAPDDLKRIFVAGPGSLLHELLEAVHGKNAFADAGRLYPMVSLEAIVAREPDVIIDLRPLDSGPEDARQSALAIWRRSGILAPAGPVGRVHVVEATLFTVYGPRLGEAGRLLTNLVHGGDAP